MRQNVTLLICTILLTLILQAGLAAPAQAGLAAAAPSGQISARSLHALAARPDGTVWAWGDNTYGALGTGDTTPQRYPVRVSGISGVTAVAAGYFHSVALHADGTVWTWGTNGSGVLGDGTTANRFTPARVPGLPPVVAVAAGSYHTLALDADGSVWAWGGNAVGQLGLGTSDYSSHPSPARVPGLANVVAIAAWNNRSFALQADGTLWAWGSNASGALGDGTTTHRSAPVRVQGLTDVISVAAGENHTVGVRRDGTVWAWGAGAQGQLGNGGRADSLTPVQVGGVTGAVAAAAGYSHTLVLAADGRVWAWGSNSQGELGNGTTVESLTPVVVPGLSGIQGIAASSASYALDATGRIWAWGANGGRQVGDGTSATRTTPVPVIDPALGIVAGKAIGANGLALAGVTVSALGRDGAAVHGATTGTDGTFVIGNLPPGSYYAFARSPAAADVAGAPVDVAAGQPASLTLQLFPANRVESAVVDLLTSAPIAGASVQLFDSRGFLLRSATSGTDGRFTLDLIPTGTYSVTARAPGYLPQTNSLQITSTSGSTYGPSTFTLKRAATVTGQVFDEANQAVGGALVQAFDEHEVPVATSPTDEQGRFSFDLPGGTYYFLAEAGSGYLPRAAGPFTLSGGQNLSVGLQVVRGGTLTVAVADGAGLPLPGATVEVILNGIVIRTGTTGPDGTYTFRNTVRVSQGLPVGTYTVRAGAPERQSAVQTVAIAAGENSEVRLSLPYVTRGRAVAQHRPQLYGTVVELAGAATYTALTDAYGFFELPGVADGLYTLTARRRSHLTATLTVRVEGGRVADPPGGIDLLLPAGDFNGDEVIDKRDLELLLPVYGLGDPASAPEILDKDLSGDRQIGLSDLALVARNIGLTAGPANR